MYDKTATIVQSMDRGVTWTAVPGIGSAHTLAFGPRYDGYLTLMSGFDVSDNWVTMFSANQGSTWRQVAGRVGVIYTTVKTAVGDPLVPGRFYIGTPTGYFQLDIAQ